MIFFSVHHLNFYIPLYGSVDTSGFQVWWKTFTLLCVANLSKTPYTKFIRISRDV